MSKHRGERYGLELTDSLRSLRAICRRAKAVMRKDGLSSALISVGVNADKTHGWSIGTYDYFNGDFPERRLYDTSAWTEINFNSDCGEIAETLDRQLFLHAPRAAATA